MTNAFRSFFGTKADELVRFEGRGGAVSLGLADATSGAPATPPAAPEPFEPAGDESSGTAETTTTTEQPEATTTTDASGSDEGESADPDATSTTAGDESADTAETTVPAAGEATEESADATTSTTESPSAQDAAESETTSATPAPEAAAEPGRPGSVGRPSLDGSTVTYEDVLGEGVGLTYEVTSESLKEQIVLDAPPASGDDVSFTFELNIEGLEAAEREDGSIVLSNLESGLPAFVMPKPFMMDEAEDDLSPYGRVWSDGVSQSLAETDEGLTVTVTADGDWLADAAREYPVVIDPTIKIAPTPTESQDVMITDEFPGSNFDDSWRLSVGTTNSTRARSLVQFPLPEISDATIRSAHLEMYWDQKIPVDNGQDITIEAREVTEAWLANEATWDSAAGLAGDLATVTELVDDGDYLQHGVNGTWPYSTSSARQHAIDDDYLYNLSTTAGETYSWYPAPPEAGDYRVDAHFVTGTNRATNAPYKVNYDGGSATYEVDQSGSSAEGKWATLGTHPFDTGLWQSSVVLGNIGDGSSSVVADAIRLVKAATVDKAAADEGSDWHRFNVTDTVQRWVNGDPNHGFMLRQAAPAGAQNEHDPEEVGRGGVRYEASEYAYGGETAQRPRLVVTYGRPSVTLDAPTTIHATGAELSWSEYVDPCGWCIGDELVEYQVHRSVYQTFTPNNETLVAPVPAGTHGYTDTTAVPTPADSEEPFGNAYYYMVAVKTADGEVIPGPTELVRLPKAGRTTRIFQADVADTTLSSSLPNSNHDVLAGEPWLSVGDNSPTYGTTRAVIDFEGVDGLPASAQVTDAQVTLWQIALRGSEDDTWQLHGLTRDFVESEATWNQAASGAAWASPGGDAGPVVDVEPDAEEPGWTNDPKRRNFDATGLVSGWTDDPTSNHGVLLRLADETPSARAIFLSSEAAEPELRPQLRVTYIDSTPESTYYVPATPAVVKTGTTATVAATVTNTTGQELASADWALSARWSRPDGTPVDVEVTPTSLPQDLAPGETVTVDAAVETPPPSTEGNHRTEHVLEWELYNTTTGEWLSEQGGAATLSASSANDTSGALKQSLAVEESTSDQVGLESFYAYAGKNTGAGSTLLNNLHAGNAVWSYDAFANPSRGLSSFLRMAYNSKDTSDSVAGYGWSLQASAPMRLGTPLDVHPNPTPDTVSLTDGDGTTHTFTHDGEKWVAPAGVNLLLGGTACGPQEENDRAWAMLAPDRTVFWFDCEGYISTTVDNNGNEMRFVYEERRSNNQPTKFLRYVTDPAGRQVLTVDYWAKGDDFDYVDDTTWTVASGSNLTNPHILDHVRSVTDISGRTLEFTYTDKGLLGQLVDGAGSAQPKTFGFRYDMTQGNKNVKLTQVTDPRGNATEVGYYSNPEDDPAFKWSTKTITDRLDGATGFAYTDPDGPQGQTIHTVVTDAEDNASTYVMDGKGRPTSTTNPLDQTTTLGWDTDNNVTELVEPNGATTTWAYDPKTGYPTEIKDAGANANGTPGTTLTYQTLWDGHIADLIAKTSPEGRTWEFGYTAEGDLASVTDPEGTATPDVEGDYTTLYTYDEWGQLQSAIDANGNTTTYGDFQPTGYPATITDPLDNATTFVYDDRGQVTKVTDALGAETTQAYDTFGRPLASTVMKDRAAGELITTPAPDYDPNDNIVTATAPNGAVSTAEYDAADQVTATLAPTHEGGPERRTTFTYDGVGNLVTQTEPNGNLTPTDPEDFVTRYTYDEIYQLTDVTNAAGDTISYIYDGVGNLSKVVDPVKNATAEDDFAAWYWWDVNHRLRVAFDAEVNGDITEYDLDGLVTRVRDKAANWTEVTRDARGVPVEVQVPHDTDASGAIEYRTTRYVYDEVGNRTKVITPRGVATPDVDDDFVHETVYDELNRPVEQRTPYDPTNGWFNQTTTTNYSYDEVGRLATVSLPPSHDQSVRNDTTYEYFDNGWTRSATDPVGITNLYDYNALGQQTHNTLVPAGAADDAPGNRTMTWDYFDDGALKTRTDSGVPTGHHTVLVDNHHVGNATATGTWDTHDGGFGVDYRTHATGTGGTDNFEWRLNIPEDGNYDVYVRFPEVSGAASDATYTIAHDGGTDDVTLDQSTNAGDWVNLGKYGFVVGNASTITLATSTNGPVVADAVKLVRDTAGEPGDDRAQTFSYGYDANGNLTSITDGSPGAQVDSYAVAYTGLNQVKTVDELADGAVTTTTLHYNANGAVTGVGHPRNGSMYGYDTRDLVSVVVTQTAGEEMNGTSYSYTAKGQRLQETKPNGNTVAYDYFLDGLPRSHTEEKSDGTLVAEHTYDYDPNGNRISDIASKMNADDPSSYLNTTYAYAYDPRDRLFQVNKTGDAAGTETYLQDANNNVVYQDIGGTVTTNDYDRNRLLRSTTGEQVATYNYDPFGRLDTVTGGDGTVIERNVYDGFDRVMEHQALEGGATTTTEYAYDPLDRTTSKTTAVGTAEEETTDFSYLGLSGEVLDEEVAGTVTKSYQYSPWGERLSQVIHNDDGTTEDGFYGYNAHTDVEAVTDDTGNTTATYGYTAYGSDDEDLFTGIDAPDPANPAQGEPYNVYRYNAKRWDQASGSYDMGFRNYSPGLNRFLTRDMYGGALADLNLGTNPYTSNRYAFGAGNPISMIELDGHIPDDCTNGNLNCTTNADGLWVFESYGSATSSPAETAAIPASDIPVNPDWGVVRINLFISEEVVGLPPARNAGDARDFSEDATCAESRVCLVLDFESGTLSGTINYSCTAGHESCRDASPLGEGNNVDVEVNDNGSVSISITATNPYAPQVPGTSRRIPSIDMEFLVGPQRVVSDTEVTGLIVTEKYKDVDFGVTVRGDTFPSVEVYQDIAGDTRTLIQDRESTPFLELPWGLFPGLRRKAQFPPQGFDGLA